MVIQQLCYAMLCYAMRIYKQRRDSFVPVHISAKTSRCFVSRKKMCLHFISGHVTKLQISFSIYSVKV
jgi:hypothetical protein